MSYKSNINNNFFSPLKIIQNKNATRSQNNIFTSSEKKKKSVEKSNDFLSSTIKKTNEEEYEEIIQKRKLVNKKIDEIIFLLSKKNNINEILSLSNSKNINRNDQKYLLLNNKKSKDLEKIKQNKILKERNIYLKEVLKEIKKKNELSNSKIIEKKNNLKYDYLLIQNKDLINENKNLKEEYNILRLEHKNNINLEKIIDNKYEIISKMKTLRFSLNNLLNLITSSIIPESNKKSYNTININNYNNNHLLKTHTINKYDLPLKIDYLNKNDYGTGKGTDNSKFKNNLNLESDIDFTEGGNLNTNYNNSFYNDNDNDNYNNYNDESSDNEQFEIFLKHFEKIHDKNINNLIINSGGINNNNNNNNNTINKNYTENVTTRQNQNRKIEIFTEKRKNTITINSFTKDMITNKKVKKDFKKYFNEGKSNGENKTNYNFFNFRNICLDKKTLFDNNKNNKISSLKNNRTSSNFNFKNNPINGKFNNKEINDNFRIKNLYQKNYKIYNNSNNIRKIINPSKIKFK